MELRMKQIESTTDARGNVIRVGDLIHPHYDGSTCGLTTDRVTSIRAVYDHAGPAPKYLYDSINCVAYPGGENVGRATRSPKECVVAS
jgi:hypothetical protein